MWRGGIVVAIVSLIMMAAAVGVNHQVQSQAVYIPDVVVVEEAPHDPQTPDADGLRLILPTSNTALLLDDGPSFYQYTDRTFEGRRSRPWQGGKYGFVRNPHRSAGELIYTRFHEGVDIQPLYRDRQGEPLDTVRTIDDGTVVYVNPIAGASSYGKYVVVEHWWSDAPFYSLYAHLGDVNVREGQHVSQGDRLGRVGYTGRGINKRRAHLHFEINMLLNSEYDRWHAETYRSNNRHGIYNGINLAGLDVADLYRRLSLDPDLTIEQFVKAKPAFYGVIIPNQAIPDLLLRYPWLLEDQSPALDDPPAWELQFTASGFPVGIRRVYRSVDSPTVSMIVDVPHPYERMTIGRISGQGGTASLSTSGLRYISMLTPHETGSRATFSGR